MAEMRMEGGGRQDVHGQQEAHMAQNPRVKPGGPAGPLDFSKEMRTIDQRERETPMRPISPQGAKAPQAAEGMRAQPFAGVAQRGPEGAPRPQGRPLARGAAPQAQENVTSDPLTGFYHRSYFEKVLISEAQKLKQNPGDCTLLYFGLDNFEQLKSRHGSPKLRKVIKDITEQLKIQMDEGGGIPGRIEENGFALFLPYTSLPAGNDLANRLRQTVSSFRSPELAQPLSISIGISSYPQTVRNFREIVVNSRKAMEKAMKSGGNRAEVGSFS
jgi:diguanylate cyclase (GGDEF)-like protein